MHSSTQAENKPCNERYTTDRHSYVILYQTVLSVACLQSSDNVHFPMPAHMHEIYFLGVTLNNASNYRANGLTHYYPITNLSPIVR